jgi:rhodanese-related sulfurtransferase
MLVAAVALVFLPGLQSSVAGGEWSWAAVHAGIKFQYPRVRHITTDELAARLVSDTTVAPILLDVREPDEFKVSHLRGAFLTPKLSDALEVLREIEKNHPVVVYCSVGYRSSELAEQLQENGYGNVYNLKGSIFQWANEGRPVVADSTQVYRVHPYDNEWGSLLDRRFWPESFR